MKYFLTGILALLTGFLSVRYMTVPPLQMNMYLLLLILSLLAVGMVIAKFFRGWQIGLALLVALAALVSGYLVTTYSLLTSEEVRVLPEIRPGANKQAAQKSMQGTQAGHTAVVYLTHGEPPGYSASPWIETFKEFDADGVSFIPSPFRTFFFRQLREEYLKVGGSPHNFVHQSMLSSLEQEFRRAGDDQTRFYISFLDSDPRPDEAVIHAINDGAARLVIMPVFLTISSHTQAGFEMIDVLKLEDYDIEVCKAEPLWDSDWLRQMYVERANRMLGGTDKSKVGILLIGHGQPADWDQIYPTQTEQENIFREDVLERLVAAGYTRENLSLAWMEFKEPAVPEITVEMGKRDIEKLFVIPASISAASIHSEYDIPAEVRAAGLPESIEVVNLGAWDNDPFVIQAIYEKIQGCSGK